MYCFCIKNTNFTKWENIKLLFIWQWFDFISTLYFHYIHNSVLIVLTFQLLKNMVPLLLKKVALLLLGIHGNCDSLLGLLWYDHFMGDRGRSFLGNLGFPSNAWKFPFPFWPSNTNLVTRSSLQSMQHKNLDSPLGLYC